MSLHAEQVRSGSRFEFGRNWRRFLNVLDEDRILEAEHSLQTMLGMERLDGKRFLDIGSGSGLFSLAARRLGAEVHSFDFDPQSVACTSELKRLYFPGDAKWRIEEGSALNRDYVNSLGQFDVVYSWGVLHHTGNMWEALANAVGPVQEGGILFIAIYNYQVLWSALYLRLKRAYTGTPYPVNMLIALAYLAVQLVKGFVKDVVLLKNPFSRFFAYRKSRGMSYWHDCIDWVGGYPFEVARPEEIFEFHRVRGFTLEKMKTCGGGLGCNEFVFRQQSAK